MAPQVPVPKPPEPQPQGKRQVFRNPQDRYEKLYQMRIGRLQKLVTLQAPPSVIGMEARMVSECFQYTLRDRFLRWYHARCPIWIVWLLSAEYRKFSREEKMEASDAR